MSDPGGEFRMYCYIPGTTSCFNVIATEWQRKDKPNLALLNAGAGVFLLLSSF